MYANDQKSGIYPAKVLKAVYNRKGFPDAWSYFVHFLGWKKSHDKWVSDAHLVWRDESVSRPHGFARFSFSRLRHPPPLMLDVTSTQEVVRAGQTLEITIWGDEPVLVETEDATGTDLNDMQDEESGNQWLYSCVCCGDGGDVAMCDAVRMTRHTL